MYLILLFRPSVAYSIIVPFNTSTASLGTYRVMSSLIVIDCSPSGIWSIKLSSYLKPEQPLFFSHKRMPLASVCFFSCLLKCLMAASVMLMSAELLAVALGSQVSVVISLHLQ